jgi:RNA polymerase sigma-70 factor (ECF subfamily)
VRAAKDGASSAWSAVFKRYERMLHGHVRTLVARYRRPIDADDLVQNTFSLAWSQIQGFQYEGEGSFRRWLHRLARNLYLNELRSSSHQPTTDGGAHLATVEDERESERQRGQHERLSLYEALAELEEEDREILLMHSDENLNLNQIAGVLECSHESARRRLGVAMARLHERLGGGKR